MSRILTNFGTQIFTKSGNINLKILNQHIFITFLLLRYSHHKSWSSHSAWHTNLSVHFLNQKNYCLHLKGEELDLTQNCEQVSLLEHTF